MMVSFVLKTFRSILKDIGLYRAIRNVHYNLPHSTYHLFSILEMYYSDSGTFFILVDEVGFALHKMFEVSLLSIGELSYEGIMPTTEEFKWLKV